MVDKEMSHVRVRPGSRLSPCLKTHLPQRDSIPYLYGLNIHFFCRDIFFSDTWVIQFIATYKQILWPLIVVENAVGLRQDSGGLSSYQKCTPLCHFRVRCTFCLFDRIFLSFDCYIYVNDTQGSSTDPHSFPETLLNNFPSSMCSLASAHLVHGLWN